MYVNELLRACTLVYSSEELNNNFQLDKYLYDHLYCVRVSKVFLSEELCVSSYFTVYVTLYYVSSSMLSFSEFDIVIHKP